MLPTDQFVKQRTRLEKNICKFQRVMLTYWTKMFFLFAIQPRGQKVEKKVKSWKKMLEGK